MSGGGSQEEGHVNIIPLLDVIFIFIFFLLMSVQFLEFFEIQASNPVEQAPPDEVVPPPDPKKSKQFKLRLSKDSIEFTETIDEKILGTFAYDEEGIINLKKILLQKKLEFPEENAMIIKPFKDVEFDKIVLAIDAAHQKVNPEDKKSEKAFRSIAFEARSEE